MFLARYTRYAMLHCLLVLRLILGSLISKILGPSVTLVPAALQAILAVLQSSQHLGQLETATFSDRVLGTELRKNAQQPFGADFFGHRVTV